MALPSRNYDVFLSYNTRDHQAVERVGRWLVTGSWDDTARLWDLNAKEPENTARVLKGHEGSVYFVAISAGGRWVITGSGDKTARLWPLRIEELRKPGERTVGRNFTRKEWEELFPGEPYRKTIERLPGGAQQWIVLPNSSRSPPNRQRSRPKASDLTGASRVAASGRSPTVSGAT